MSTAKTRDRRFRCRGCNARLGRIDGMTLTVEGHRVVITPTGASIECPGCRDQRTWHLTNEPRRSGARRATIHLGGAA